MTSTATSYRNTLPRLVLVALSLVMVLVMSGCSSENDPSDEPLVDSSSSTLSADEQSPADIEPTSPTKPDFCESTDAIGREIVQVGTPTDYLPPKTYTLTLETNCGTIEIAADAAKAPATVTTIGFLANAKYYDASVCHRLTTTGIFVLQCGDPSATGAGGPGFNFKDENLPSISDSNYPAGTIAMANSGPNTNGSQFFIVYQDTTLPPNYSIWGKVTKGLDIVEKIAANGTANGQPDGSPKYPVEIRSARLK